MSYLTRNLKQDISYWAPAGNNSAGFRIFSARVTIKGRWEEKRELFRDASGNEVVSEAKVYLKSDVTLQGYLFLGISTEADPTDQFDAKEIRNFDKTPNLKATQFERLAIL